MKSQTGSTESSAPASVDAAAEVLVLVEGVSKKFCRSLKQSLWYGLADMAGELNPFSKGRIARAGEGGIADESELRPGEFWAVHGVSFELRRGECLGLIGHNGAGKTTLLKMLNGLIKPDAGSITMRGRIGALIALGAGFNPILTGRENIYVNGSVLGLSKEEIDGKLDDIIDFADLRDFIDAPVQSYSSGMQVRLGFAVATAMEPDVLILDEVLAVGDRAFRSKCMARITEMLARAAVILVSHDDAQIRQKCDRVVWLAHGEEKFCGETSEGLMLYQRAGKSALKAEAVYKSPVERAEVRLVPQQDPASKRIEFHVVVDSCDSVEVDYVVVTIESDLGVPAAQCMPSGLPVVLRRGRNEFKICFDDLQLAPGQYYCSALFSRNGGKLMLFNSLFNLAMCVERGEPLWADYQPRATIA